MNILEKIEQLRNEGKSPNEIEQLLLSGKLGKIITRPDRHQYIRNIPLSYLAVEVHEPGFVKWMHTHQWKYVTHHKDGNPLNNAYSNLRVMGRSNHSRIHRTAYLADPANAEDIKATGKKISAYYADPANAKDVEAAGKKLSKAKTAYYTDPVNIKDVEAIGKKHSGWYVDPVNAEAVEAIGKKISETKRKNWITPESDPEFFERLFTVGDYAEVSKVSVDTAWYRLKILLKEDQIVCEKMLVSGRWCNIYHR